MVRLRVAKAARRAVEQRRVAPVAHAGADGQKVVAIDVREGTDSSWLSKPVRWATEP